MEGERQLDRAEVRSEVAAVLGDGLDHEVTDLAGEVVEVRVRTCPADLPAPGSRSVPRPPRLVAELLGHGSSRTSARSVTRMRETTLFDLTGHVALVTGGNSGIGLGMADALAAHGADVSIWGTNPDKNDAAADQLQRHGGRVQPLVCDVGDHEAVTASMAAVAEALGRIDSCFVNAGVGGKATSFVDMSEDEWRRVMRVNLDGAFFTAQEAVRHMVARHERGDEAAARSCSRPRARRSSASSAGSTTRARRVR